MDIGGVVAQQFTGPLNELAHTINKLIIVQVEGNSTTSGNPLGSGVGGSIAGAALGAAGLGAAASAIQKIGMGGKKFEVQINPEKYDRRHSIDYFSPPITGGIEAQHYYSRNPGEELSLSFTLDGTGVVPSSITDLGNFALQNLTKAVGVTDVSYVTRRLKELNEVVGKYIDDTHDVPRVKIIWGDEEPFQGRMRNLAVTYTLFHPSGVPLRAEVKIDFVQHSLRNEEPRSPDLTHGHTVTQFDTLPLMTEAVYGDATFLWQVASTNGLTHFRRLKTGDQLHFPALDRRPLRP
jgi:Contractile injection system tube protein